MKNIALLLSLTFLIHCGGVAAEKKPTVTVKQLWETTGLKEPESIVFDAAKNRYYVSNVNGKPLDDDKNGFISIVSVEGKLVELEWLKDLSAPKGLGLYRDTLYVADLGALYSFDISQEKPKAVRYEIPNAQMPNDVVIDEKGTVYVSDMLGQAVYTLTDGKIETLIHDDRLNGPNGLWVEGDKLYGVSFGSIATNTERKVKGGLWKLDLTKKSITLPEEKYVLGALDGLSPDGNGNWLAVDWTEGTLFQIFPDGSSAMVLDLPYGSADFAWVQDKNLIVIPMMADGKMVAYQLGQAEK